MKRPHRWVISWFAATLLIDACAVSVFAQSGSTTRPARQAAAASRPAQALPWTGCVTGECHANIKLSKVLHGPVGSNHCDACHELADAAAHHFTLTREKEQVCTYCHEFRVAKMLPVVHTPVKRGECVGCHDPH